MFRDECGTYGTRSIRGKKPQGGFRGSRGLREPRVPVTAVRCRDILGEGCAGSAGPRVQWQVSGVGEEGCARGQSGVFRACGDECAGCLGDQG